MNLDNLSLLDKSYKVRHSRFTDGFGNLAFPLLAGYVFVFQSNQEVPNAASKPKRGNRPYRHLAFEGQCLWGLYPGFGL